MGQGEISESEAANARSQADYERLRANIDAHLRQVCAMLKPGAAVLEVGSGAQPSALRRRIDALAVPVDYQASDIRPEFGAWDIRRPVPSRYAHAFDQVFAVEVFEHIDGCPHLALRNVCDALKSGGRLVATVPFMFREHEPRDLWRFTRHGLRLLAESVGLIDVTIAMTWQPWQVPIREPLNLYLTAVKP